jgi:DNA-binding NtrC family response regulator
MISPPDVCAALPITDNPAVLIVDDDPTHLYVLSSILMENRPLLLIETCHSSRLAAQKLAEGHFDAAITDLTMPELSGWDILAHAGESRPCTPVLLMTGHTTPSIVKRAFSEGFFDFIGKPIDREGLISSVNLAIKTHRLRRRIAERRVYVAQLREVLDRRWIGPPSVMAEATVEQTASVKRRIEAAMQQSEKAIERTERSLRRSEDLVRQRAWQRLQSP